MDEAGRNWCSGVSLSGGAQLSPQHTAAARAARRVCLTAAVTVGFGGPHIAPTNPHIAPTAPHIAPTAPSRTSPAAPTWLVSQYASLPRWFHPPGWLASTRIAHRCCRRFHRDAMLAALIILTAPHARSSRATTTKASVPHSASTTLSRRRWPRPAAVVCCRARRGEEGEGRHKQPRQR